MMKNCVELMDLCFYKNICKLMKKISNYLIISMLLTLIYLQKKRKK